jgi:hypothetical protein
MVRRKAHTQVKVFAFLAAAILCLCLACLANMLLDTLTALRTRPRRYRPFAWIRWSAPLERADPAQGPTLEHWTVPLPGVSKKSRAA